jgi:hypothetical protein
VAALQSEVSAILKTYDLTRQFGKYHDGGWRAISLMAGGANYRDNRATTDIQKTEPLRNSPYLSKVLESFAVPTERVRLMQLDTGKRTRWHYEGDFLFPEEKVRLHVPIITNDGVRLQFGH